ncbi:hypothetical protein AMECASPLE_029299 [Ameca splendens]|uniref:Uncharacterized protein n=1 Tax=Ameca splendens TaxID=208324 RepID=A0ABV0Z4H9_9TELE
MAKLYKNKHLDMQAASTIICERIGRPQELSKFLCGPVIACHLCNRSSHESVSFIASKITKWNQWCRGWQLSAVYSYRQHHVAFRLAQEQLCNIEFHGRAAPSKPNKTKSNTKH